MWFYVVLKLYYELMNEIQKIIINSAYGLFGINVTVTDGCSRDYDGDIMSMYANITNDHDQEIESRSDSEIDDICDKEIILDIEI